MKKSMVGIDGEQLQGGSRWEPADFHQLTFYVMRHGVLWVMTVLRVHSHSFSAWGCSFWNSSVQIRSNFPIFCAVLLWCFGHAETHFTFKYTPWAWWKQYGDQIAAPLPVSLSYSAHNYFHTGHYFTASSDRCHFTEFYQPKLMPVQTNDMYLLFIYFDR